MAQKRYRNFRAVVWLESANPDWIEQLELKHIPCHIILHDHDLLDDGTLKKPHYHVVLMFDGVKTCDQVLTIMKECCGDGVNIVLPADSILGSVRYLTHIDNPSKYQYSHEDVISLSGADYLEDMITPSDINHYRLDIQDYIELHNITSYRKLSWFVTHDKPEWSRCVNAQTMYWVKYLVSREDDIRDHVYNDIDDNMKNYYKECNDDC